ncbi:hypothetical protein [Legionella longbeachae]|uniref:hypothetical protein n=1 Tax=Legionella longbeachae TaxID=450 RepID=UPI001404AB01|nr:hypothetical protein [Legionella longbeachae]QIN34157.1 hypothetical protein GCS73_00185 [Legionella longbeachae]HBD7399123.1 hypothetical protein [Legionella pneumophila]
MINSFGSIVIKTTSFNLQEAVSDCKIGIVKYITEQTFIPENDPYSICIHKRDTFQHENELRLVHVDEQLNLRSMDENNPLAGIKRSVDMNLLIDEIYVSHLQPNYFYHVKKLCEIYGIEKPIFELN